jgi:Flp pilus assembly protein TadB
VTAGLLAGVAAGLAVLALARTRPRLPRAGPDSPGPDRGAPGLLVRHRLPVSALAGVAAFLLVGGPAGAVAALLLAGLARWMLGRVEPPAVAREREAAARELPHLVLLTGAALRSGAAPERALGVASAALPGPAAARLAPTLAGIEVGVPLAHAWADLASDPVLGPLGRALARSLDSGAPVADAVERLADELAERSRADVEDRARTVGVRAALPLGTCLLPAFLLLGIVPVVAALLAEVLGG